MKFLYISASNIVGTKSEESTSYKICKITKKILQDKYRNEMHSILELKNYSLTSCIGCGKCWISHRCIFNDDFNDIYTQIIDSDFLMFVSPHYAPIPAKLAALLEKMEQITFLHWGADNSYKSEVYGKPTAIISHGGGSDWALKSYKLMVNDTIANALDTIQLKLIPFNDEWNTGISLPVDKTSFSTKSIFPEQSYNWEYLTSLISNYIDVIIHNITDIPN